MTNLGQPSPAQPGPSPYGTARTSPHRTQDRQRRGVAPRATVGRCTPSARPGCRTRMSGCAPIPGSAAAAGGQWRSPGPRSTSGCRGPWVPPAGPGRSRRAGHRGARCGLRASGSSGPGCGPGRSLPRRKDRRPLPSAPAEARMAGPSAAGSSAPRRGRRRPCSGPSGRSNRGCTRRPFYALCEVCHPARTSLLED